MQLPQVSNPMKDAEADVIYNVMAYRKLSRDEVIGSIRYYLSQTKKKPKRGSTITIVTIIGATD